MEQTHSPTPEVDSLLQSIRQTIQCHGNQLLSLHHRIHQQDQQLHSIQQYIKERLFPSNELRHRQQALGTIPSSSMAAIPMVKSTPNPVAKPPSDSLTASLLANHPSIPTSYPFAPEGNKNTEEERRRRREEEEERRRREEEEERRRREEEEERRRREEEERRRREEEERRREEEEERRRREEEEERRRREEKEEKEKRKTEEEWKRILAEERKRREEDKRFLNTVHTITCRPCLV